MADSMSAVTALKSPVPSALVVAAVNDVDNVCWAWRLSARSTPGAAATPGWGEPWEERVAVSTRATSTAAITRPAMVTTMVKPASVRRWDS